MLTEDKLAELEAAEAKATDAPWRLKDMTVYGCRVYNGAGKVLVRQGPHSNYKFDAELIAIARNNLKALIDEVKALRKLNAEYLQQHRDLGAFDEKILDAHKRENQTLRAQLAEAIKQRNGYRENYWAFCNPCAEDRRQIIEDNDEALAKISGGGKNG